LASIKEQLTARNQTLQQAIEERQLYFRISVVGNCNLSCEFCHNEGAPARGRMNIDTMLVAVAAAKRAGFSRVQFTGGEPLLHPEIAMFVARAREHIVDVGITTNGTFLEAHLASLVAAGVSRVHVSLQTESLILAGDGENWGVPDWLAPTLERAAQGAFSLRLNLPVPANDLVRAERFLDELRCDIKAFSILPEGEAKEDTYPSDALAALVARVNSRRAEQMLPGQVFVRGYRPPAGIRCPSCANRTRCKEQSHSLRLGADLVLRPCLATRDWDIPFEEPVDVALESAALLALDYRW